MTRLHRLVDTLFPFSFGEKANRVVPQTRTFGSIRCFSRDKTAIIILPMMSINSKFLHHKNLDIFFTHPASEPPSYRSQFGIYHQAEVLVDVLPGCCHGRYQRPETTTITVSKRH